MGATCALLPEDVLHRLSVEPRGKRRFLLADNREALYPTAWVLAKIDGDTQPTIIVFGEPGCDPLLGAVILEEFGRGGDPIRRQLIPVPGLLK